MTLNSRKPYGTSLEEIYRTWKVFGLSFNDFLLKTARACNLTPEETECIGEALDKDIEHITKGDPAAGGSSELVRSAYLGPRLLAAYRCSAAAWKKGSYSYRNRALNIAWQTFYCFGSYISPAANLEVPVALDHCIGLFIGPNTTIGAGTLVLDAVQLRGAYSIDAFLQDPATYHKSNSGHPFIGRDCVLCSHVELAGPVSIPNGKHIRARTQITTWERAA